MNNKRNTSKEKSKRNKGFPYKSRIKIMAFPETKKLNSLKWKIVNKEGKIIDTFRTKCVALEQRKKLEKVYFEDLFIEEI